jgi:hypothetical protein
VTEYPSCRLVDDASVKFLTVHYSPDQGGPKALLAYSGLAMLPDQTQTGTWLRETLRGESEVFDQSIAHLRTRLDRDVAPLRLPMVVNALVVQGQRRYFGGFSNIAMNVARQRIRLLDSFGYVMQEVGADFAFANGSGAAQALAEGHFDRIRNQLSIRPRKVTDHMKLLATINRRVAAKTDTVSPHCQVSYINADEQTSPTSHVFLEPGEHVPFEMPILLFGVDLSGMMRRFQRQSEEFFRTKEAQSMKGLDDDDVAAINEELKRRP